MTRLLWWVGAAALMAAVTGCGQQASTTPADASPGATASGAPATAVPTNGNPGTAQPQPQPQPVSRTKVVD